MKNIHEEIWYMKEKQKLDIIMNFKLPRTQGVLCVINIIQFYFHVVIVYSRMYSVNYLKYIWT